MLHEHEITYCVVMKERKGMEDIISSYNYICTPIVQFLKSVHVDARFVPINDIVAGGRKISGSAQTRRKGTVMQHGTLLLRVDPVRMFSLLRVGKEKIRGKAIRNIEERVTSLERETGREWQSKEVMNMLTKYFARHFNARLVEDKLNSFERKEKIMLIKKYRSEEWNFMR